MSGGGFASLTYTGVSELPFYLCSFGRLPYICVHSVGTTISVSQTMSDDLISVTVNYEQLSDNQSNL